MHCRDSLGRHRQDSFKTVETPWTRTELSVGANLTQEAQSALWHVAHYAAAFLQLIRTKQVWAGWSLLLPLQLVFSSVMVLNKFAELFPYVFSCSLDHQKEDNFPLQ